MTDDSVVGFNLPDVEKWVADNVARLQGPFQWERLLGGHSNLTYALTARDGQKAVIAGTWVLASLTVDDQSVPFPTGNCRSPSVDSGALHQPTVISGPPSTEDAVKVDEPSVAAKPNSAPDDPNTSTLSSLLDRKRSRGRDQQ